MTKRSSKSRKASSSSSSSPASASPESSPTTTHGKMVLRVRPTEKTKKTAADNWKTKSRKKPKTTSSKKKASKIDALKPKKPPTAFFYFLEDFRKEFQEKNPDVKSMRDIGKACGEKWKAMTYEEKVQYYDIATEKRAEFDRAMADFNRKKESGELLEYEDDSDFDE